MSEAQERLLRHLANGGACCLQNGQLYRRHRETAWTCQESGCRRTLNVLLREGWIEWRGMAWRDLWPDERRRRKIYQISEAGCRALRDRHTTHGSGRPRELRLLDGRLYYGATRLVAPL